LDWAVTGRREMTAISGLVRVDYCSAPRPGHIGKLLQILIVDINHEARELDVVMVVADSVLNGHGEQASIQILWVMSKAFREIKKIVVCQSTMVALLCYGTIGTDIGHGPASRNIDLRLFPSPFRHL
jgi:hypothetical protein